jgi:hypothetical protein
MRRRSLFLSIIAAGVAGVAAFGWVTIRHGFSARDNPSWMETFVARTTRSMAVPSGAKPMRNPIPSNPDNLAEARAHFADHCAICHANNGSGKTEIGQNLYPKPPDMRLPPTQNLSDGELYYVGAVAMSLSTIIVAVNAQLLRRLKLQSAAS